jgi:hypothetical protein
VEYGTESGNYTSATSQSTTDDTAHSVTLTGLSEGTTYYYRLRNYHHTLGESITFEMSFETASTSIGIEVTNLIATANETGATITWTTNVETTHLVVYGIESGEYTNSTTPSSEP